MWQESLRLLSVSGLIKCLNRSINNCKMMIAVSETCILTACDEEQWDPDKCGEKLHLSSNLYLLPTAAC